MLAGVCVHCAGRCVWARACVWPSSPTFSLSLCLGVMVVWLYGMVCHFAWGYGCMVWYGFFPGPCSNRDSVTNVVECRMVWCGASVVQPVSFPCFGAACKYNKTARPPMSEDCLHLDVCVQQYTADLACNSLFFTLSTLQ